MPRSEYRRRDRSWERDDRDRDRTSGGRGPGRSSVGGHARRRSSRSRSRSRSPSRKGDGERRDRRDYGKDRDDDRRVRDRRDGRRRDEGRERERRRDERRDIPRKEDERDREKDSRREDRPHDAQMKVEGQFPAVVTSDRKAKEKPDVAQADTNTSVYLDTNEPVEEGEEEEAMDTVNEDDAAMMASMGLNSFGSTKGKHVTGNQEGGVDVKKMRTWRQYMNRRGGFNRPLDKIK